MTFFEAIKNMTIEELSAFLAWLTGQLLVKMGVISEKYYKDNYELLIGMINSKLAAYIDRKSNGRLEAMIRYMKKLPMEIVDTNSWDNAQVTAGGVSTSELDYYTMESKISKGLYITGELMDIDGTCGGYNLQWAWSTGYIAGNNV